MKRFLIYVDENTRGVFESKMESTSEINVPDAIGALWSTYEVDALSEEEAREEVLEVINLDKESIRSITDITKEHYKNLEAKITEGK